jgi:hypothetical protein
MYLYEGDVWHNHWIPEICKFPAFMERVKEIWNEFYKNNYNSIYTFIDAHKAQISKAAAKDKERWPQYHGSQTISTYIDRTTNVLRKNAEWLNGQWKLGNDEGNGNDNGNSGNPEYDGEMLLTDMYVWLADGKQVVYNVANVDSITFVQRDAIVVRAKVPDNWKNTIYVWIWGDGIEDNEHVAKKEGDWYVFAYEGEELNIIFKNGSGWTGHPNQTEDIYTTQSACYQLYQEGEEKAVAKQVNCEK